MKIRTRAFLLGIVPALLLAALLVGYLSLGRLADLESALRHRGLSLTSYVSESAQYAVVSGNIAALTPLLEHLREQDDVVSMTIRRGDGTPLLTFGAVPEGLSLPLAEAAVDTSTHIAFSMPVKIQAPPVHDPFLPETREPDRVVAWVHVVMSRASNQRVAREMLFNSLLIVGLGLVFTVILVRRLALTGIRPLMEIIDTVRRIGEGDLSGRLAANARSELRGLQLGINRMCEGLASSQQEMLRRIDEATAELTRQKEAAEQANQAKSKFLAAASHDLRQPLYALGLFSATLKQTVYTPGQIALVEKIEASVHALEDMFNTLLDLSRLEAGILQAQTRDIPLQQLFDRIARDHALQAEDKGLRFVVRPTSLRVHSDPLLLQRILSNLVSNALRYTRRGGVLLAARRRAGGVRVEVWDTGIGIETENLSRIFDEYFQVDNAARDRRQGLGLGLNIVRRLGELLGHAIEARSRPGLGSTFSVNLPAAMSSESCEPERRRDHRLVPGSFSGQRVLVIEDDADVREALRGLLESWGLTVLEAGGAGQALRTAGTDSPPDLVISDYRLSAGENGIDTIASLRRAWNACPRALLISGDIAPESVAAMSASGLPVLHKPVHPARLRAVVATLLQS